MVVVVVVASLGYGPVYSLPVAYRPVLWCYFYQINGDHRISLGDWRM